MHEESPGASPVLLRRHGPDGRANWVNEAWLAFAGGDAAAELGDGWARRLHPDDRERALAALARARESGAALCVESRLQRADGEYRWFLETFVPEAGAVTASGVDITAHKRDEARLRESRSHLQLTTEAAQVGTWQWDVRSNEVRWSPIHKRLWGYEPTPDPIDYRDWADRLRPEDLARAEQAIVACLEGRARYDVEYRMTPVGGGEERWIRSVGQVTRDAAGRPDVMHGVSFDITARRQVEEALRESERHWRDLADTAPAMLWITQPDAQCTFLSRGWYEYTGQTEAQALGLGWVEAVHPDDREGAAAIFLDANARRVPFSLDYRLRRADGAYRWAIDSGRPRFGPSGEFLGYIGSVIDVHERKQAEQALAASEERFREIFRGAGVSIWEEDFSAVKAALDEVGASSMPDFRGWLAGHPEFVQRTVGLVRLIDVNDATLRLFGARDKAELLQSLDRIFLPETLPVFVEELVTLAEGRTHMQADIMLRTLDGRVLDLLFTLVFPPPGGTCDRVLVTLIDITERKRAEAEVREADRRKDEFLATLAHELRNPLAPIANALQLLRMGGRDEAARSRVQEIMDRQVRHLVRLVDDLLEISRITRGTFELKRERVSLAAVVRNAVETAEPLIAAEGHRLEVSLPREPAWLDGDPVRLAQILANLLNNAAKYTERGGRIALAATVSHQTAVVSVRDTGAGFTPQTRERLFEMFSRGPHTGRARGGLGIGLALSRRLAEMHGGSLEGHSEGPGRGAEFIVRLPLAAAQGAEPAPARANGEDVLARKRILLVDDNRDAAESLGMLLSHLGAQVRLAHDGYAALEAFEEYDPDLLLLDLGMPGLDGYEVARRIRERHPARRAPIVALSGWGQEEDRRLAREAGFDHHLIKPTDSEALRALLERLSR